MAPAKDKWIRRFIITETRRHKKGFTIYKITSMVCDKYFKVLLYFLDLNNVVKLSVFCRYF